MSKTVLWFFVLVFGSEGSGVGAGAGDGIVDGDASAGDSLFGTLLTGTVALPTTIPMHIVANIIKTFLMICREVFSRSRVPYDDGCSLRKCTVSLSDSMSIALISKRVVSRGFSPKH